MSRTHFIVNPNSIAAWMSRNALLETGENLKLKWLQWDSMQSMKESVKIKLSQNLALMNYCWLILIKFYVNFDISISATFFSWIKFKSTSLESLVNPYSVLGCFISEVAPLAPVETLGDAQRKRFWMFGKLSGSAIWNALIKLSDGFGRIH